MKQEKSLIINSVYSVLYKLLNVLFPLFTATYTARILLADGIGKVSYAQNIVQYFVIIASLGIPNYGIREIAKVQGNKEEINKVFTELFLINFVSTTICITAYVLIVFCVEYFRKNAVLFYAVGIILFLNYFNVDWFYQGKEEYSYIAVRSGLVKLISLISLFIFVKDSDDYAIYAIIYCIATAGNYIFNIFNLKRRVKLGLEGINIKRHLKPVFILLASNISIELYTLVDITMLGIMCSDSVVGFYHTATKLARIINSTISSIALVLLPRLSYYRSEGLNDELNKIVSRVLQILIVLTIPASVGIFLLSDNVIRVFFGESFILAVQTLQILSVLIVAVALNNYFGTQILLTFNREIDLLKSVLIGAGINLILNSVLIPKYSHNGAAIASSLSEISVLLSTYLFARQQVELKVNLRFWGSLFVSIIIMIIAVIGIKSLDISLMIQMILGILVGVIVYGVCGMATQNEGIIELSSAIKKLLLNHRKKL